MKKGKVFFGVFFWVVCISLPYAVKAGDDANPGDIVINEFLVNPDTISDTNGEWLEIHNTTDQSINIDGWELLDEGSDNHIFDNGGILNVPADGKLVLCVNADVGTNGGVVCDYELDDFVLGNSGDEIILEDESDQEIARIVYPGTATWNTSGRSSFYIPSNDPPPAGYYDDNSDLTRWGRTYAASENLYGTSGSNYGTPGAANTQSGDAPTAITLSNLGVRSDSNQIAFLGLGVFSLVASAFFIRHCLYRN